MAELLFINSSGTDTYGQVWVGQSVKATADWLVESVWIDAMYTLSAGNAKAYIYLDNADKPVDSALATSEDTALATTPGGPETFTFGTPYQMTADLEYWFIFHIPATQVLFFRTATDVYTDGNIGYSTDANNPVTGWATHTDVWASRLFKVNGSITVAGMPSGRRGFTTRSGVLHHRR